MSDLRNLIFEVSLHGILHIIRITNKEDLRSNNKENCYIASTIALSFEKYILNIN